LKLVDTVTFRVRGGGRLW